MSLKKSVLFINRVYPPHKGATGRVLKDLAHGFVRGGWDVHILTTDDRSRKFFDGPITIHAVGADMKPRRPFSYLMIWIKMYFKAMRLRKADLVVSMTDPPMAAVLGAAVAKAKNARHIHWLQDMYPDLLPVVGVKIPGFAQKKLQAMAMRAMQAADKVVVIGRCMAQRLIDKGMNPGHITYLPNWPDQELCAGDKQKPNAPGKRFRKTTKKSREPKDQLRDGPKFRVLYAGNIGMAHPMKAILEAAIALHDDFPEIEFVFVGGGKAFDFLAHQRAQRGLNNIRLIPFQPSNRLLELMESGDVHLITMKEEAKGMLVPSKFYAALAARRPAIFLGPEGAEVDLVLKDFKAGVTISPDDGAALAAQIVKYRQDGDYWYGDYDGAKAAGDVYLPEPAIKAWIERAESVVD